MILVRAGGDLERPLNHQHQVGPRGGGANKAAPLRRRLAFRPPFWLPLSLVINTNSRQTVCYSLPTDTLPSSPGLAWPFTPGDEVTRAWQRSSTLQAHFERWGPPHFPMAKRWLQKRATIKIKWAIRFFFLRPRRLLLFSFIHLEVSCRPVCVCRLRRLNQFPKLWGSIEQDSIPRHW